MADQYEHLDLKRYLPHAIVMTLAVIMIPIVIVVALIVAADPNPPVFVTTAIGVVFGMLAVAVGSALWLRRPESSEISFGDLMIWGWWRRKRAEDQLARGTRLLGLDRSGHPRRQQVVSREEQEHILRELTAALESKDPYTHGHSRRVERHVYRTAMAMGFVSEDIEDLRKAAALHDVGKIRVPDRILRKPEALTAEERSVLEDHVVVGAWMVSSAGNADVVSGVRHHHEQWDGSGYPDGLSATEIPLFSRIIAVADTFDAITSTRPYRAGENRDRAIEVLRAEAGRQFDPTVVDAFIQTLPAPVPITAGMLTLVAGPRALLARAAVILKRVGAGALAPAAGATGAAILVGASTITPGAVAHDRLHNRPAQVASGTNQSVSAGPAIKNPSHHRKATRTTSRREVNAALVAALGVPPPKASLLDALQGPSSAPIPQPTSAEISVDGIALSLSADQAIVGSDVSATASALLEGDPAQEVTVVFLVAGTTSRSETCVTDSAGQCAISYQGPSVPGSDTVTACGDANRNGAADADEPCDGATVTWISPPVAVQTTGSGEIANVADEATIAFEFSAKKTDSGTKGTCEVIDSTHVAELKIECTNVSTLTRTGSHVSFGGQATVDGAAATYRIDVDDNGNPGKGRDRFEIQTSTGYSAGGILVGGNIQVHG